MGKDKSEKEDEKTYNRDKEKRDDIQFCMLKDTRAWISDSSVKVNDLITRM